MQIDVLTPYLLPYPPVKIWAEFDALAKCMFAGMELHRKESLVLAMQRDALLPKLISGELRVRNLYEENYDRPD